MAARQSIIIYSFAGLALAGVTFGLGYENGRSTALKKPAVTKEKSTAFNIEKQVEEWLSAFNSGQKSDLITWSQSDDQEQIKKAAFLADSMQQFGLSGYYLLKYASKRDDTTAWIVAASRLLNAGLGDESPGGAWCITEAGKAADKVLEKQPGSIFGRNIKAEVILRSGDDARVMEAVTLLKGVLSDDASNLMALENLGMLQMRSGQWPKAELTYRKLNELNPVNPEFYVHLADCLLAQDKKKEAKDLLQKSKTFIKDPSIREEIDHKIQDIK